MRKLPIILPRTTLQQFRWNLTIQHQIPMIQINPYAQKKLSASTETAKKD